MTDILLKQRQREIQETEAAHVKMQAQISMMQLQVKNTRVLATSRRQGKGMEQIPPSEPQKETTLLTLLISDFWPSKL